MQIIDGVITWDIGDIVHEIDVDFYNKTQFKSVLLHQYDYNSTYILATVWDNSSIYTIPTGAIVTFNATKPDGKGIDNKCVVINNQIVYQITEQTTPIDGDFYAEFRIYDTVTNVDETTTPRLKGSPKFKIYVEKSALSNDTVISTDEFNVLTDLIINTQTTINDVNTAKDATVIATTNANNATAIVNQTNTNVNNAEQTRITNENERIANEELRPDYLYVTQAEYDALSQADKDNPKYIYEITDDDGELPTNLQNLINDVTTAKNNYDESVSAGSNTEVVEARKSSVTGVTSPLLKDRLNSFDSSLATIVNKTVVTLSHQFADITARDTYFTTNPTELVENLFIKVGAGYQQYINSTWQDVSAVLVEMLTAQNQSIVDEGEYFDSTNTESAFQEVGKTLADKVDLAIIDTQTGTSIQSTVADDSVVELKIEGASYQLVTTQGKNRCPTNFTEWESGEYLSTDGTKAAHANRVRLKRLIAVNPSTTYYAHTNETDANYTIQLSVRTYGIDGAFKRSIGGVADGGTFITNADEYYIGVFLYSAEGTITYSTFQTDFANGAIKPFICLNSEVATTYEPFTPNSPSPDYPAPITNANNFDVVACRKNLLPRFTTQTVYGVTMTVASDGTITLNGTASATFVFNIPMNQVLNGQYCMSANNKVANSEVILRLIAPLSVTVMSCALSSLNAVTLATFINQTITNLNIRIGTGQVFSNFIISPQLEKGSLATPYELYKSNQVNIPYELSKLTNGVADTIEYIGGGKAKVTQRIGRVVFDGSADEGWARNGANTAFFIIDALFKVVGCVISDKFPYVTWDTLGNYSYGICEGNGVTALIGIRHYIYTDIPSFKTWLASNPVTVQYELATPIETIIDLLPLTSYKGITNVFSTSNPQVNITGYFKSRLKNAVDTLRLQLASKTQNVITVPTFTNAWVVDGVFGYFINAFGELEFVGAIKSGTLGASAFTLAVGYRPLTQKRIACVSNGAFGYIVIGTDGTVKPYGSNTYISLDGIRTRIDV